MVAGKNYNLQTKCKKFKAKSSHICFASAVPAGMTRYVTCVGVIQDVGGQSAKGSRVIFCSAAASGTATNATTGSAIAKLSVGIGSYVASHVWEKTVMIPPGGPDAEHPLFTIAASKWFVAVLGSAAGTSGVCEVFAQWYDQ
jgi:hypothetical protein